MSSRYERKVGPADVGQSIGLALQSFAQQLKLAQEKERIKQQGAFLTDFTTGILDPRITTQEELLPAAMERLAAAKRMGIDPSGGINIFAQVFGKLPSREEKARQDEERKVTATGKKLELAQKEEEDRKTQAEEKITYFLSTVPTNELIDPAKRSEILARAKAAALPLEDVTPDLEAEVASLVPGVIERFEKANAKDIEEMRESAKRAKLSEATTKIISAPDFRTDPSKYAAEFIEAGGDVTSLIKLASAKDDQEYAKLQRDHINRQIDSISEDILTKKENREENKAIYTPELIGKIDLMLDEKHFNSLTQKSEPLYTEAEKIAQRNKLKGIADAMGYKWLDITGDTSVDPPPSDPSERIKGKKYRSPSSGQVATWNGSGWEL